MVVLQFPQDLLFVFKVLKFSQDIMVVMVVLQFSQDLLVVLVVLKVVISWSINSLLLHFKPIGSSMPLEADRVQHAS